MNLLFVALKGLTQEELSGIVLCLYEKNSVSGKVKSLYDLLPNIDLKRHSDLIAREICEQGGHSFRNIFRKDGASYRKIREKVAGSLGYSGRDFEYTRSQFLLDTSMHKPSSSVGALGKTILAGPIYWQTPAYRLLEKIVPIIERSYQFYIIPYANLWHDKLKSELKNGTESSLDAMLRRVLPRFGVVPESSWTSLQLREAFNLSAKDNNFKYMKIPSERMYGCVATSEGWELAVAKPDARYTDVVSSLIGINSGLSAASEHIESADFYKETCETLRKQIAGKLDGSRGKGAVPPDQYKGDIFERLQVLFFNRNAEAAGSPVRAYTTNDLGLINNTRIDIAVLSPEEYEMIMSLSVEEREAVLFALKEHYQAKCCQDGNASVNKLKKYQGTKFLGTQSKQELQKVLQSMNMSEEQKTAFLENYSNTVESCGLEGVSFSAEEALEIAKSSPDGLSPKAKKILLDKIDAKMKNLYREVVGAAISAAFFGGVIAALLKWHESSKSGVPFAESINEILQAGAKGALRSGLQASMTSYVVANSVKFAVKKGWGAAGTKLAGRAAGAGVAFVIESTIDLYDFTTGEVSSERFMANMGNNILSGAVLLSITASGGLAIAGGVVAGMVIKGIDPVGKYLISDYDSILEGV